MKICEILGLEVDVSSIWVLWTRGASRMQGKRSFLELGGMGKTFRLGS